MVLVWTKECQSDITQKNSRNCLTEVLLPEILKVKIILGRVSIPCASQVLDRQIPALPWLLCVSVRQLMAEEGEGEG